MKYIYFERYPQNSQDILGPTDIDGLKEVWFDQKLETTNVNEGEQWYILHPVSLIGYWIIFNPAHAKATSSKAQGHKDF